MNRLVRAASILGVAQIFNLPYRRIAFGRAGVIRTMPMLQGHCGLQVRDTADSKSALRCRSLTQPAAIPLGARTAVRSRNWTTAMFGVFLLLFGCFCIHAAQLEGPAAAGSSLSNLAVGTANLTASSNALAARAVEIEAALAQAVARAKRGDSNTPAGMPAPELAVRRLLLE